MLGDAAGVVQEEVVGFAGREVEGSTRGCDGGLFGWEEAEETVHHVVVLFAGCFSLLGEPFCLTVNKRSNLGDESLLSK